MKASVAIDKAVVPPRARSTSSHPSIYVSLITSITPRYAPRYLIVLLGCRFLPRRFVSWKTASRRSRRVSSPLVRPEASELGVAHARIQTSCLATIRKTAEGRGSRAAPAGPRHGAVDVVRS